LEIPDIIALRFHDADGGEVISAIHKALGNDSIPVKGNGVVHSHNGISVQRTMRELVATRPFWQTPIQLDNTQLIRFLAKNRRQQGCVANFRMLRAGLPSRKVAFPTIEFHAGNPKNGQPAHTISHQPIHSVDNPLG
jgi:hypothetical protein